MEALSQVVETAQVEWAVDLVPVAGPEGAKELARKTAVDLSGLQNPQGELRQYSSEGNCHSVLKMKGMIVLRFRSARFHCRVHSALQSGVRPNPCSER